jgi:hypothetical protein
MPKQQAIINRNPGHRLDQAVFVVLAELDPHLPVHQGNRLLGLKPPRSIVMRLNIVHPVIPFWLRDPKPLHANVCSSMANADK